MELACAMRQPALVHSLLVAGRHVPTMARAVALATGKLSFDTGAPVCALTASLVRAAALPWRPATHFVHGLAVRGPLTYVTAILVVARRLGLCEGGFRLPHEVWLLVLSFARRVDTKPLAPPVRIGSLRTAFLEA